MNEQEIQGVLEAVPLAGERSVVKIETNSKGQVQGKIAVYEGVTEAEMERLRLLAVKTFQQLQDDLGPQAQFG